MDNFIYKSGSDVSHHNSNSPMASNHFLYSYDNFQFEFAIIDEQSNDNVFCFRGLGTLLIEAYDLHVSYKKTLFTINYN